MQRASIFQFLLEHQTIYIQPGELIVGEKGPAPKVAPTYPELCCHSLQDLDLLNSREKIPFSVDGTAREIYADHIIPFWREKSMRELIFAEMEPAWLDAYEAGVFTEFMEQRSPGHTVLDNKIYSRGMLDFIAEIDTSLAALDYLAEPQAYEKGQELRAMRISAAALIRFAERYAEKAEELAAGCGDTWFKDELLQIAAVCRQVPAHAPRTFRRRCSITGLCTLV